MRLPWDQQSPGAGEALILSRVLDGLQYLCRSWQERIRWPCGNSLAGLLSTLGVLQGILGAEVALTSLFWRAFRYLGHPKYRPRKQILAGSASPFFPSMCPGKLRVKQRQYKNTWHLFLYITKALAHNWCLQMENQTIFLR